MNRLEYFKTALREEIGRYSHWVFSVFTVTLLDDVSKRKSSDYPYKLYQYDNQGVPCFCYHDGQNIIPILEDGKPVETLKQPLINYQERLVITKEYVYNAIDEPELETSAGTLFVNFYCLLYHVKHKLGYFNGRINPKQIESKLAGLVQDDVPEDQRDENVIYVSDDEKIRSAIGSISGFAMISAPSATPYTVTVSPKTLALRDKLFEEYKDRLDDPITVVNISKQVQAADKAWVEENDENKGFYIDEEKSFSNVRQNIFLFQGLQTRLNDKSLHMVKTSISEGPKIEDIPALFDTMRAGSYARGAATPLGGEAVKFIFRVFGNTKIIMEDCGTKMGVKRRLTEENKERCLNHYILDNGTEVLLDSTNVGDYMGKVIEMRSPTFCQADTEGRDVCVHCMGPNFRNQRQSLGAYCSEPASQMMYVSMKKMHSNVKTTTKINLDDTLS